jgi:hypothetical protein
MNVTHPGMSPGEEFPGEQTGRAYDSGVERVAGGTMANKDRGGKQVKKQAAHSLKEKRLAKKEKKGGAKKAI